MYYIIGGGKCIPSKTKGDKMPKCPKQPTRPPVVNINDGGRADAGYKGKTGDCVVRSIATATGKPYQEVYDEIWSVAKEYMGSHTNRVARHLDRHGTSPRNGVHKEVYAEYLKRLGWKWTPTMQIGSGCKVHLTASELPAGRIICRLSKHLVAVIDGVVQDTGDPTRCGKRCVYGYWTLDTV